MDDRELLFHSVPGTVPSFQHSDADLARDPLSTNRRLINTDDLPMFGMLVVAGATADQPHQGSHAGHL